MNTLIKFVALVASAILPLTAITAEPDKSSPSKSYKVVIEVTGDGVEKWLAALRNVENAQNSLGAKASTLEVVAHGKGLGMLLAKSAAESPELKAKLEKLHADGVMFAACENSMRHDKVEKKDLVEQATTVDSGVGEVIRKQGEGYAYLYVGS